MLKCSSASNRFLPHTPPPSAVDTYSSNWLSHNYWSAFLLLCAFASCPTLCIFAVFALLLFNSEGIIIWVPLYGQNALRKKCFNMKGHRKALTSAVKDSVTVKSVQRQAQINRKCFSFNGSFSLPYSWMKGKKKSLVFDLAWKKLYF